MLSLTTTSSFGTILYLHLNYRSVVLKQIGGQRPGKISTHGSGMPFDQSRRQSWRYKHNFGTKRISLGLGSSHANIATQCIVSHIETCRD